MTSPSSKSPIGILKGGRRKFLAGAGGVAAAGAMTAAIARESAPPAPPSLGQSTKPGAEFWPGGARLVI